MLSNELIKSDYIRAQSLYSNAPPTLVGRLVMSQESAQTLPVSLDEIYGAVFQTVETLPKQAQAWAQTFGTLSVNVALSNKPTGFQFDRVDDFKPAGIAEIATAKKRPLIETFYAAEVDAPNVYLLADDDSVTVEMALIQALHLVDTAMVTGQYDGQMPLVQTISSEQLAKLKCDNPDIFLRSYGNVRKSNGALNLLGSVVPVSLLEASMIDTQSLSKSLPLPVSVGVALPPKNREQASFIGITTAKRPHIGHGFLLAKAISESGYNGNVLVELNDQGPRVKQALAKLAIAKQQSIEEVAVSVSTGMIDIFTVEDAYKNRSADVSVESCPNFSLASSNEYYRALIEKLTPSGISIKTIADSELPNLLPELQSNDGYTDLFSGAGMSLIVAPNSKAVVTSAKSELTVAGILGVLGSQYDLNLVDSPPPVTNAERAIFKDAGIAINQSSGVGVMIDFAIASGTNGNTILLDDLIAYSGDKVELVLPTLRKVMNEAYFLPSEGNSFSPNFASKEALLGDFKNAFDQVGQLDSPFTLTTSPMILKDVKKLLLKDLLEPLNEQSSKQGKPTFDNIQQIIDFLPVVRQKFSDTLVQALEESLDGGQTIPKYLLDQGDRTLVQAVRSGRPDVVIESLLLLAETEPDKFNKITAGSQLQNAVLQMGYDSSSTVEILKKFKDAKGVYVIQ